VSATAAAVRELGAWAAACDVQTVPTSVRERLRLVLLDTVGVTIAGARTAELAALRAVWPRPPGPAAVLGEPVRTSVESALWLNGTAACCLELDEGDKFARGHPAAHAVPAALAVAAEQRAPGAALESAVLVGHEVAARFGRATVLHPGVHPHGNWGAAGAAAAAGRLLGLDAGGMAGAIDAACGLVLAPPFDVALDGGFVRNTWVGAANAAGVAAARLAAAGLAGVHAIADASLGRILGAFDPRALTAQLGERFDVTLGYFKRHASCSYTHPPADAALALRADGLDPLAVTGVEVATHHLAAPLDRTDAPTRLAAMFSIPHVVAVTLLHGDALPVRFDAGHREDTLVRRLAGAVSVRCDAALDARLPEERAARLTVTLTGGRRVIAEVANPVGDADHLPFGPAEVAAKLDALLAPAPSATDLTAAVERLLRADDVSTVDPKELT
jgi:2-methylcitrate dehydratase PrpD